MKDNCVEYGEIVSTDSTSRSRTNLNFPNGKIDYEDSPDTTCVLGRGICSCFMTGIGLGTICTGAVTEGMLILGVVPLFWAEEVYNYIESCLATDPEEEFKYRINDLAEQVTQLPCADFSEYNSDDYKDLSDPLTRKRLLTYLNNTMKGCDWFRTEDELFKIDPRIHLVINNKDGYEVYSNKEQQEVLVNVEDSAWLGSPTSNTMISSVDTITEEIATFKYLSDYE